MVVGGRGGVKGRALTPGQEQKGQKDRTVGGCNWASSKIPESEAKKLRNCGI
jgi:hypothetical protein